MKKILAIALLLGFITHAQSKEQDISMLFPYDNPNNIGFYEVFEETEDEFEENATDNEPVDMEIDSDIESE
ncbi:MAG: hypothetical protein ABIA74_02200 [bacterium]